MNPAHEHFPFARKDFRPQQIKDFDLSSINLAQFEANFILTTERILRRCE